MSFAINPPDTPLTLPNGSTNPVWYRFFSAVQKVVGDDVVARLQAAPYISYAPSTDLLNAKVLTQGSGMSFTSAATTFTVAIASTGVTAGSYGSASQVPSYTVNARGQLTAAANITITPAAIGALAAANNLSDVANAGTSRANLGLGTAAVLASDTDGTLLANSDSKIATQKAVKTYVDNAVTGLLDFKGATDCSGNPNYPAASKGDAYVVSVAGKIGGASGTAVDVGDVYVASADNAGGTQAAVGSSWFILEHNLAGALLSANNLSDLANAATARTNLGLGTIATQAANNVSITGGSITGITDLAVADGGTGSSTAAGARTSLGFADGTYTPTLTHVANLDASTAYACQYLRVGNTVTVSGRVDIDATAAATSTKIGISLPIASNLTSAEQCGGTAVALSIAGQSGAILGDSTNDRAQMTCPTADTGNSAMFFHFTYQIL